MRLGSVGISAVGAPLAAISQRFPGAAPPPPHAALSSSGFEWSPPGKRRDRWLLALLVCTGAVASPRPQVARRFEVGSQTCPARAGGGGRGAGAREGGEAGRASTCGRTWPLRDLPMTGSECAGLTRTGGRPAGVRRGGVWGPGPAFSPAPAGPGPMHGSRGRLQ